PAEEKVPDWASAAPPVRGRAAAATPEAAPSPPAAPASYPVAQGVLPPPETVDPSPVPMPAADDLPEGVQEVGPGGWAAPPIREALGDGELATSLPAPASAPVDAAPRPL